MSDRSLRNGMAVRFRSGCGPRYSPGEIHEVGPGGFSVQFYSDGQSLSYEWADQDSFEILQMPEVKPTDHDAVVQELLMRRLDRDLVEELLARYCEGLALDLEEIAHDQATTEKYRLGMVQAASRLRKAEDRT